MTIHYIAEYEPENNDRNLSGSPAGIAKMNYVIKTILNCGFSIHLFSTSRTMSSRKFYNIRKLNIGENSCIILRSTFSAPNRYYRLLDRIWAQLQILLYGLFCVARKDVLLIYHERYYLSVIKILKRIKKISVIYEIEEIYTVAAGCDSRNIQKEIRGLGYADAYLVSNDIMVHKLGFAQKPFLISYGRYQAEERRVFPPQDGILHIVYAGTLDAVKAGAVTSIRTAQYLDKRYHLHILGFGSEQEIQIIKEEITRISSRTSCKITYEGCLKGEQFTRFLQTCHIGLNAQNPREAFNDYSFPSKILTYMANGLQVIATRVAVLEKSSICSQIVFAKDGSPEALANAIKSAESLEGINNQKIIERLDSNFNREFKLLMQRFLGD